MQTANGNTLVGYQAAGDGVVTGATNTAVGANSVLTLTSGSDNAVLGQGAGKFLTTGAGNTFLGSQAGLGITGTRLTGDENVAMGKNSGVLLQGAASDNTLVGAYAFDNLTTGGSNTGIGYNLNASAVGVTHEILIGSNTTGAGTHTVRIGTFAANATLNLDGSDTSWAAASDARLKDDVVDSTVGLEFIKDLRPVTFKWKAKNAIADTLPRYDANSTDPVYGFGKYHHGFIAQEVKAVIDSHSDVVNGHNIWSEDPDGTQQLAPAALVPMLVKAIQELEARVAELEG